MGAMISRIDLAVNLKDVPAGIDMTQSKRVDDNTVGMVTVDDTYVLPLTQPAFQQLSVGDITTISSATIIVTAKDASFDGVSVGFGAVDPVTGSFTVKDIFTFTGALAASGIWVKNLDAAACTIQVIMTGI